MDLFKRRLATGLAVLIPLGFTLFALRFVYNALRELLLPFLQPLLSELPAFLEVTATLGLLVLLLLIVGQVATHVVGRRVIAFFEQAVARIPLVRAIYGASKQVVDSFSTPRAQLRTVVMVEFPSPGMRAIGFLTNTLVGPDGGEWCAVFIPTTPNPTTGFLQMIPAGSVQELDWEIEDAVSTLMSLGVLTPGLLSGMTLTQPTPAASVPG
jgi:uncharacterized membrane protein